MNFLKNLFKSKSTKSGIVFIVEDNQAYASSLRSFIELNFPELREIKIFPVGETCVMELHRSPDIIIIDYFLDSKYSDAESGLETIKHIRAQKPNMNLIVLSSQSDIEVVIESVKKFHCTYIKKDENTFERLKETILEIQQN